MQIFGLRRSSERGAVVIQVAVCLLGLLAFTSFVVDYGVMWTSRGQAQTAADAGALAGGISLAYEPGTDSANNAKLKASEVAKQNLVWGQAPNVQLTDVTFPPCPPGAPGAANACVKVDVFRNQARGNQLPMFFGNLVGVGNQGVRATATAQVVSADTTNCLKHWAIVDRWDEYGDPPEPDYPNPDPDFLPSSTFDKYSTGKGNTPPQENDLYVPPSATTAGTGFRLPADEGLQYALKVDSNAVSSGWFRALNLPRLDGQQNGADVYNQNIASCNGLPSSYAAPGTVCPATIGNNDAASWAALGCYSVETGAMRQKTKTGVEALVAGDPGASWNVGSKSVVGSAFTPQTKSPRVVAVGVMNIDLFMFQNPTGSGSIVRLENIFGLFVEGMGDVAADGSITLSANGNSVIGRIMTVPGTGSSKVISAASFMRNIILVR